MKGLGLAMDIVSAEEKEILEQKLKDLMAQRPIITERIAEARALGDLKENAEYHAARDDQGKNEMFIRELEERLKNVQVADDANIPDDMVFVGSTVKLLDVEEEEEDLYKIVGEASGNFDADEIEVTTGSPLGEALMKARVGETVAVDLPAGIKHFKVMELL